MISKAKILIAAIIFFVLAGFSGYFFLSAPKDFPSGETIVIEMGTGLAEISGKYLFNEPVSVFSLTSRLAKGEFGFKPIKVMVAEGLTIKEIADLLLAVKP